MVKQINDDTMEHNTNTKITIHTKANSKANYIRPWTNHFTLSSNVSLSWYIHRLTRIWVCGYFPCIFEYLIYRASCGTLRSIFNGIYVFRQSSNLPLFSGLFRNIFFNKYFCVVFWKANFECFPMSIYSDKVYRFKPPPTDSPQKIALKNTSLWSKNLYLRTFPGIVRAHRSCA